ncbi:MAG: cysteine rich repeat-containing protein [Pseudobdellovibrionaceae bacterium]
MAKLITICALVLCFGSLSQANDEKHHEGPCAKDREALCGKVEPGEGRVMKCMEENKGKVSPQCKEHMEEMGKNAHGAMKACHEDMEKFCGKVEHGEGRVMKCMKEHKDSLSSSCKEHMEKMKDHMKDHMHKKDKES